MSPELKSFYQSYQTWLDAGAPWHEPYNRHAGLCENLCIYLEKEKIDQDKGNDIEIELGYQFYNAKLSVAYPFNNGNSVEFNDKSHAGHTHLNEKRNQWVKEHAT